MTKILLSQLQLFGSLLVNIDIFLWTKIDNIRQQYPRAGIIPFGLYFIIYMLIGVAAVFVFYLGIMGLGALAGICIGFAYTIMMRIGEMLTASTCVLSTISLNAFGCEPPSHCICDTRWANFVERSLTCPAESLATHWVSVGRDCATGAIFVEIDKWPWALRWLAIIGASWTLVETLRRLVRRLRTKA